MLVSNGRRSPAAEEHEWHGQYQHEAWRQQMVAFEHLTDEPRAGGPRVDEPEGGVSAVHLGVEERQVQQVAREVQKSEGNGHCTQYTGAPIAMLCECEDEDGLEDDDGCLEPAMGSCMDVGAQRIPVKPM